MKEPIPTLLFKLHLVKDEKICPYPAIWYYFWEFISHKLESPEEAPTPYVLSGWYSTDGKEKILRFWEQIEWSASNNVLQFAYDFLSILDEDNWLHTSDWNDINSSHKAEWDLVNGKPLEEHKLIIDIRIKKREKKCR